MSDRPTPEIAYIIVIEDGTYRRMKPVGILDVHENGVKAINCDLDPGKYALFPLEADDE